MVTPKIDNKRPKSVPTIQSTVGKTISSLDSDGKYFKANLQETAEDNRQQLSTNNYCIVTLKNIEPEHPFLEKEMKLDSFCEIKTLRDKIIKTSPDPLTAASVEEVKRQEIETDVTCSNEGTFSESDDILKTGGIESCIDSKKNSSERTSTFCSEKENFKKLKEEVETLLLYDKQFQLDATDYNDVTTLESHPNTETDVSKCQIQDDNEIKIISPSINENDSEDDLCILEKVSIKDEFLKNDIEKNCTNQITSDVSEDIENDLCTEHESDESSEADTDPGCYVNFPDDLRPSHRLPQRLTSRRSTALFPPSLCCTEAGGEDLGQSWDPGPVKQGHGGCWRWLSTRF